MATLVETDLLVKMRELAPEFVQEFEEQFAQHEPIAFVDLSCGECGALVNPGNHERHRVWHQDSIMLMSMTFASTVFMLKVPQMFVDAFNF